MSKPTLHLKPTEIAIVESASRLYAAYLIAGRVREGDENASMERALKDAMKFARAVVGVDRTEPEATAATRAQSTGTERGASAPPQIELVPDLDEPGTAPAKPARKTGENGHRPQPTDADKLAEIDRVLLDDEMHEPSVVWSRQRTVKSR